MKLFQPWFYLIFNFEYFNSFQFTVLLVRDNYYVLLLLKFLHYYRNKAALWRHH